MQLYVDYKIKVTDILTNYTSIEKIHSYSIDESFLDVTESLNLFYPGIEIWYMQMNQIVFHDRGMMRWGAFATGELTEVQNTFEKEQKKMK